MLMRVERPLHGYDGQSILQAFEVFGISGVERQLVGCGGCSDEQVETPRAWVSPGCDDVGNEQRILLRCGLVKGQGFELQAYTLQPIDAVSAFDGIGCRVDASAQLG